MILRWSVPHGALRQSKARSGRERIEFSTKNPLEGPVMKLYNLLS